MVATGSVQSLMGPPGMVVLLNVFSEQTVQVPFTKHDDVIEELPAYPADKPFDVGILPGTPVSRAHFLDAAVIEERPDSVAVDVVVVTEHVSRLVTEGRGFPELLNDPCHGGMVRGSEMNHLPATVFEDDKHVETGEAGRDHRKEVHGPGDVQMVAEKRQPSGWLVRLNLWMDHVLADCVAARRIIAEQSQCIPDSLSTPQRIPSVQLTNYILHLLRYGRPATPPSRLPTPVETKRSPVPSLDRRRPHEMSHLMPLIPHPREQHPQ